MRQAKTKPKKIHYETKKKQILQKKSNQKEN